MYLVGFIIRIYHDARSPERQMLQFQFSFLTQGTDFCCVLYRHTEGQDSVMLWQ